MIYLYIHTLQKYRKTNNIMTTFSFTLRHLKSGNLSIKKCVCNANHGSVHRRGKIMATCKLIWQGRTTLLWWPFVHRCQITTVWRSSEHILQTNNILFRKFSQSNLWFYKMADRVSTRSKRKTAQFRGIVV